MTVRKHMQWRSAVKGRVMVLAMLLTATAGCAQDDASPATATSPSTTPPSTAAAPAVPCGQRRTVTYAVHDGVDPNQTSLDVYLPPADAAGCTGRPLVVWVHGGGWSGGDKSEYMTDKITLFNGAGYVFGSVNYRLTDTELVPPAPIHPVHDQDTADALAWFVDHAAELGVDPSRIAVLGHSAGGGIVAAITTDARYLGTHGLPIETVRCAGSMDGEGYDIEVGATYPDPTVQSVYRSAFGEDPATWEDASPLNHIAAGKGIPDYFVAARGPEARLDLHQDFVTALREAGVPTTVLDARELEHADLTTAVGAPDDTVVTPALMAFLTQCLGS